MRAWFYTQEGSGVEGLRRLWPRLFSAISLGASTVVMMIGLWMIYASLPPDPAAENGVTLVSIAPGMNAKDIAGTLHAAGVIRDPVFFLGVARVLQADTKMQAGIYQVAPRDSVYDILHRLTSGQVVTRRITVPEGYTVRDIAALLARHGLADEERFLQLADGPYTLDKAGMTVDRLEGYLFPDTYDFAFGMPEEDIIAAFVDRFQRVVLPWVDSAGTDLSLHEIVTLASIVEKEAARAEERPLIAGVYLNRLRIGMPLQADPTVMYVLPEKTTHLLYSHLAYDSPYNTYMYKGLPPGPIANPGLASIQAVLAPAKTDYLYFVARHDGSHHFSRTYEEHLAARESIRGR